MTWRWVQVAAAWVVRLMWTTAMLMVVSDFPLAEYISVECYPQRISRQIGVPSLS